MLSTCQAFPRCRGVLRREGISLGESGKGWPGAEWKSVFPSVTVGRIEFADEGNLN